ncbi:MAG TPA: glycosyl hydrolase family 18 protein [Streptosporangiaceae bacterium]|nr:glycosyl hydrolase family 18 protein [Streptosporangiaceae bacterium]
MRFRRRFPARRRALAVMTFTAMPIVVMAIATTSSSAATAGYPARYSAPYLQVAKGDVGDMSADMKASGTKDYTLAFLTPKSGCTPQWEDNGDALGAFTSQVQSLQNAGGNVIISFGGASGGELAVTCTSVSSLKNAYANVVNTYGVTRLDFDIEGNTLNHTMANSRRNQALAALQQADSAVTVDYTLAVNPNGLPPSEVNLLKNAVSAKVNVNLVNIMVMDFGSGQNVLSDAESAAKATVTQMESIFGISATQAWNKLGLTPIAGKNDDDENFTLPNANTLESFAASNGVQELAFWEVDSKDKPLGYTYSGVFNAITSGVGSGGS